MKSNIKILENDLINKIAAGEVIESPVSVVKELIENAIDAKALKIHIEIKKSGLELIRVEDDGSGMTKEEAILCFKRHATSKIKTFDDLLNISSMGFRGEALASIASVSKIDLKTSIKDIATFVKLDSSKVVSIKEIARKKGSTIEVKQLFFNVPVRKKFQKTLSYINSEIIKTITLLALSHPQIEFKLVLNEKLQIFTNGSKEDKKKSFQKRIKDLLSKDFVDKAYFVDYTNKNMKIFGYISSPNACRKTRSNQYLIINNRVVTSPLISKFIKLAYATRILEDEYPIFALNIEMPPFFIDVNVHPQKKEIRLREELFIKEAINKAISLAFEKDFLKNKKNIEDDNVSFESNLEFTKPHLSSSAELEKVNIFQKFEKQMLFENFFEIENILDDFLQVDNFLFIESKYLRSFIDIYDEKMILIDLASIYTSIFYERLKNKKNIKTQKLLIPINITLNLNDASFMQENMQSFSELGFVLHFVSKDQIVIEEMDEIILRDDLKEIFFLILEDLKKCNNTDKVKNLHDKKLAKKISYFAKTKSFSKQEAINLLNLFFTNKMPFFDPLGNKILVKITKKQIEKIFY